MQRLTAALVVAATLALGGCASQRTDGSKPASAEPAARISTPVAVPAASARKLVLTMTGPKQVVESKDWADLKNEWRATFADHAKAAGIEFSVVEGDVKPQAADGTVLVVDVADYRMVGIGARIMFGIMTGNAYINAKVKFVNLRDGSTWGEKQFNTTSSAWEGVFGKVTPQQVDAIANDIFADLKAAK